MRQRNPAQPGGPAKWLGHFKESRSYPYLGDYQAKMLGVGVPLPGQRMPSWYHTNPVIAARSAKGGASRLDRGESGFRGWG